MLDDLLRTTRRATAERALVTPCCGATATLLDYRLHCQGMTAGYPCPCSYERLAELVAVAGRDKTKTP